MQLSNWIVILAVLIIIIGSCLATYGFTVKVVEKNGKVRSSIHWVYIAIGLILLIIGILIIMLKIFKGCKCVQSCVAMEGELCISVPKDLASNIRKRKQIAATQMTNTYISAYEGNQNQSYGQNSFQ